MYSNDLQGLVTLSDGIIGSGHTEEIKNNCQRSTEFHFPNIEHQLDKIVNLNEQVKKESEKYVKRNNKHLQTGDFYITKHSNLSQIHVIFHVVTNNNSKEVISSRHPVLLGLRNIIKTACSNDVTSLMIPLLLTYDMSEVCKHLYL